MKVIIPMAGNNEDFRREGMDEVKHMMNIDGKSMIEHVCGMFPQNSSFIFLCRKAHLDNSGLMEHLQKIVKNSTIIVVENDTRGPVETVLLADGAVRDDEEVIIAHSDAISDWDFSVFLKKIKDRKADGALSTFIGFHPTHLNGVRYASISTDDNDYVVSIKEKELITKGYIENYTSAGVYYFSRWDVFKKYAERMIENVEHEMFYISLVYNEMLKDGLKVVPFEAEGLIYWGEPQNLKEYVFWSEYFASLTKQGKERGMYDMVNLIPSAGRGKRFADAGYKIPKPFIDVLGEHMIVKCAKSLPKTARYVFVCLRQHVENFGLDEILKKNFPECDIVIVNDYTDGMARSCLMAKHLLDKDKPVFVSSCDYSFVYNDENLRRLIEDEDPDAVVWTFRGYPDARIAPMAYAYMVVENGRVKRISEKVPISDEPHKDPIVQGIFYFKTAKLLIDCINEMIEKNITVNGEFYVGTAINHLIEKGMKVMPFELDKYICWGTPHDLLVFQFWENYFINNPNHPYKRIVPKSELSQLKLAKMW